MRHLPMHALALRNRRRHQHGSAPERQISPRHRLDRGVDSVRSSGGARVSGVLADAATEEGAAALVRATPSADILVNNLGIYEMKDFAAITDADWRRYFEVNVLSGARLARAYFPGMLERNWGRI